jgi:acyl-coenzyme A thioesterase PaaI-like protein
MTDQPAPSILLNDQPAPPGAAIGLTPRSTARTMQTRMHVTDLGINKALGMQLAPPGNGHILEMPETPQLLNHVGSVHASVQFALAEASSGEFLLRYLGDTQSQFFAVLRTLT